MSGKDAILFQRSALSATVTTQPGHSRIQMQIRIPCNRQLVGMRSQNQIQCRILKSRYRQTVGSHKHSTLAVRIGQGTPAYILVVAHILRFREIHKLASHRIPMLFDKLSALAVSIVIDRATSVISEVCILLRDFHYIS